jgi:hypothetical protein
VARIDWIAIRDTFGVATLVGTCATQSGDGVGRQFQPSNSDGSDGDHPLLVVVPSSMGALRSDTRELVSFQRDEAANLAWGIERVAMGPTGRGVDRPWFPSDFAAPDAESHDPFELLWRLSTPVASTWIPLVAVVDADGRRLVRAGLLDSATDQIAMPVSQLLNSVDSLRDEEVTRSGVQVRVVEQLARWYDGSTYCWRGRESRPSGGEASSKLRFDGTFPPKA